MIETGNRNFWIAQIVGWGLFSISNFIVQYMSLSASGELDVSKWPLILNSLIAFLGGLGVTTMYRYFIKSRGLNLLNFRRTLLYIVVSTIILTLLFLLIVSVLLFILHEKRLLSALEFFGNFFIFGILMLIWNSLYFMIHYLHSWKNSESDKWQLAASMKEAQLGSLKAQINPHFMFNAINNIRALISEDPDRAKDMLLNFSDMFRYSLVHTDQSLVTLEEELMIVKKFLELLSIQFEEKLTYKIEVDDALLDVKVPPMMLQLLVENAIKHGISELAGGGVIKVNVAEEEDQIILAVENTRSLSGEQQLQKKLGVGLNNIRERLNLIYNGKASMNLLEMGDTVLAKISLPRKAAT